MKRTFIILVLAMTPLLAQTGAKNGEWPTYGGDLGNTRYSALDQINAANFDKLQVAWRFKTDNLGPRPEANLEGTPLMVKGVLYSTAGTRRSVVALDAATGELLWVHGEIEGQRGTNAPRQLSGRGLAYWTDGRDERIIYVTPGYQMVALDAKTGIKIAGFGKAGMVDLKTEDDQEIDPLSSEIGLHSAPMVSGNTVIVGAAHKPGGVPTSKTNVKGYVRGYDVRTGKRLWIFHTIPKPGEFGLNTWEKDSWAYTGNTGAWGQMSIDEQLGLVYIGVEMPTGDYFGGHRPGAGLFGESLVAVDLKTGARKWHYQYVHHGIWDMDNPCPPILTDITINGRTIKAVAQPTKQAFMYVLNRETGEPIWPIVEKPVEKGDVPTEWYSPTQPFPTKPPAFDRQGISVNDLIDFTPALRAEAVKLVARYKLGPMFTPGVVSKFEGPLATLTAATAGGGSNWPGGSYDPETHIAYVSSQSTVTAIGLVPGGTRSDMNFISGQARGPEGATAITAGAGLTIQGLPLLKPPYGRITAIDLNKGEIAWQVAHGDTPDNVRTNPALQGMDIPRTGRPGQAGTLVTKTLLIAGEKGVVTMPDGRRGAYLRAYNKATGQDAGKVYIPAPQSGSPMTYALNGKQYIVVAISGQGYNAELVAFALPSGN
ncbi:MAG TPA: PQQ-binding-like beta-propeller repeat protein [Bryobacteraceae bacterium]